MDQLTGIFRFNHVLIPISITRVRDGSQFSYTGVMIVRIFGLRVASIQLTNPW